MMSEQQNDFELPLNILRQNPNKPGDWQRWSRVQYMRLPVGNAAAANDFAKKHKDVFVLLSDKLFRALCDQAAANDIF